MFDDGDDYFCQTLLAFAEQEQSQQRLDKAAYCGCAEYLAQRANTAMTGRNTHQPFYTHNPRVNQS